DLLPYYVEALLVDDQLGREIARNAYEYITGTMSAAAGFPRVYPLLEALADRNAAAPLPVATRARPHQERAVLGDGAIAAAPVRSRVHPPRDVPVGDPVYDHGALLKRLFLANQRLGRRVGDLEQTSERANGAASQVLTYRSPAWGDGPGDVTVVVPVHNYEQFVDE